MSMHECAARPRFAKGVAGRGLMGVASAAIFSFALLGSCSSSNSTGGDGGISSGSSGAGSGASSGQAASSSGLSSGGNSSGSSSGNASSGSSGSSSGLASSSSGGSSSGIADAGSDGAIVCTNTDRSVLQEDATGFIFEQCNEYTIQGSWYCFSDMQSAAGGGTEGCVKGVVPYVPGKGMCLSGSLAASFNAYAAIGLELNATGGANSTKNPYNATANGIIGFAVSFTGTTSTTLRVGFTDPRQTNTPYIAPFATQAILTGAATTTQFIFADVPPMTIMNQTDTGATVEPTMLEDIQIEVAGTTTATETYDFCITSITPIFSTDGGCPEVAGMACDPPAILGPVGDYAVQNNISMGGSQCITTVPGASCAQSGYTVTFPSGSFGVGGNVPSSYPSVIYGWQNGGYYGISPLPKQLSAINSANTSWSYTVPSGTTYDAAYDIWLGPASTSGPGDPPGLELMVWTQYSGPTPAGSQVASGVTVAGVPGTWDVYKGQVNTWQYLAYRATQQSASVSFDLNDFFKDADATNKYNVNWNGTPLSSTWFLWGVQAGFEVYNASQTITTSNFQVSVQ